MTDNLIAGNRGGHLPLKSNVAYLTDFPKINLLFLLVALCAAYATIVPGMVSDWYHDENYSHGFLVPLISVYFLVQNWAELKTTPLRPSNVGLLVIIGSLMLLLLGFVGTEYFTMRSSLVFLLAGIVLYWFGWVLRISPKHCSLLP